jgi:hypothetical protein
MKKATPPISLAGSQLGDVRHVCAFFNNDEEEYRVWLLFIKGGFECGAKAVHVVNPDKRRDHLRRLTAAGIDPAAAERSGQLEVRMRTHPMVIIGDILQRNPFFVPPEEFLPELRQRRGVRNASSPAAA